MSDQWETYPRTTGDHQAWITYNHGLRESIASLPYRNIAKIRATLRDPDERGAPTKEEATALYAIEDDLAATMGRLPSLYAGRISVNGSQDFFFYTDADANRISKIVENVETRHEHKLHSTTKLDLQRDAYWNELFPTEAEWQLLSDLKVEISLRQAGDKLERSRKVRHYAYFTSEADRAQFVASVGALFDATQYLDRKDSFGVELEHVCCPDHASINPLTVRLGREAKQFGGEYDGWETLVVRE